VDGQCRNLLELLFFINFLFATSSICLGFEKSLINFVKSSLIIFIVYHINLNFDYFLFRFIMLKSFNYLINFAQTLKYYIMKESLNEKKRDWFSLRKIICSYFDHPTGIHYFVSAACHHFYQGPGIYSFFNCFFFNELLNDSIIKINLDADNIYKIYLHVNWNLWKIALSKINTRIF
jgi:hypothetical protein